MKSKKNTLLNKYSLLFLLFLSIIFTAHSQKQKCTIYFDDNTSITGLGKIKGDNFIKFKLNDEAKSTDYDPMIIDRIVIENDGVSQVYKYKKQKDGSPFWLKVITEGKVSLYKNEYSGHNFGPTMSNNGINGFSGMNMVSNSVTIYYIAHGEEFEVSVITSLGSLSKNFKKTASEYFKDCPVLVEKISNKEYKKDDIYDVVKFYNSKCNTENTTAEVKTEN